MTGSEDRFPALATPHGSNASPVHPTERTLVRPADALDADLVLVERERRAVAG
jgi:hypothetical protein